MKAIKRISITDEVIENIKESIDSGEYKQGEKLPTEFRFCELLEVSRTSVREAIRVLQALGYVTIKTGKGAYVADRESMNKDENWYDVKDAQFHDFMEVRMAIETLSVRLSVEKASKKQIKELDEIHHSFIEANENQDMVKLIMLDELFHKKIIEFTNNQLLININKQVSECFKVYRSNSFTNNSVYKNAVEPHEKILKCFHTHNSSQAVQEMKTHLEITSSDMEKIHDLQDYKK